MFASTTAEQVVSAVEAVVVAHRPVDAAFVASFADFSLQQATSALELAEHMGLVEKSGGTQGFVPRSPLARYLNSSNQAQRATVLRVTLEQYEPFVVFRERLPHAGSPTEAARQTKALLSLTEHHEAIKDTLINCGTYAQAISAEGGGQYSIANDPQANKLQALAGGCADLTSAEGLVRQLIGEDGQKIADRNSVILELASALVKARDADGRGSVVCAGNAVDSLLASRELPFGANLTNAHGINQKADGLRGGSTKQLPKKIQHICYYLGHVRNAADHGLDSDVNAAWQISPETGLAYVFVACTMIAALAAWEQSARAEI